MPDQTKHDGNTWSSRGRWAFGAFAVVGAFFLFAEHRAHVLPFLPWLILLACPLMHVFMHGGHGGHGGGHGGGKRLRGENGSSPETKPEGSWNRAVGPKGENHSRYGGRT